MCKLEDLEEASGEGLMDWNSCYFFLTYEWMLKFCVITFTYNELACCDACDIIAIK